MSVVGVRMREGGDDRVSLGIGSEGCGGIREMVAV